MNGTHSRRYRAQPGALVRAPGLPLTTLDMLWDTVEAALPAGDLRRDSPVPFLGALRALFDAPGFSGATRLANPLVAEILDRARNEGTIELGPLLKLTRYLVRSCTRTTPFGLFSGVSWARTDGGGGSGQLLAGEVLHGRARLDSGVLMTAARERVATRSADLTIRRNDLATLAQHRVWLPLADAYGDADRRSLSVQVTPPLALVFDKVGDGTTLGELRSVLADAYPTQAPEALDRFLGELLDTNILVSSERMQARGDGGVPPWAPRDWRVAVAEALDDLPGHVGRQDDPVLRAVERTMTWDRAKPVLHVDSALQSNGPLVVPQPCRGLAEEVADTLLRLDTTSCYPPHLTAYAKTFAEEYGAGARVPLLHLLCEETGLGPPDTYSYPSREFPLAEPTEDRTSISLSRVALLQSWISQSLTAGGTEIDLSDADLEFFAESSISVRDVRPLAPASDVCFTPVQGPGEDWTAVCSTVPSGPPGSFVGRFWDVVDQDGQCALRLAAGVWGRALPGVDVAELTYLPTLAKAMNVATRAVVQKYEIPVNVEPSVPAEQVVPLDGICVGVRDSMLVLWDGRTGREIVAVQSSLLNLRMAPNAVRFLLECSFHRFRPVSGFDWGNLEWAAPFLPRLRHGRVVVRPASWSLRAAPELRAGTALTFTQFEQAVVAWRARWRVPRHVFLTREDNRLHLDLDRRASLFDLWWSWKSDHESQVCVSEVLPGVSDGILRDTEERPYSADVVLTVERSDLPDRAAPGERSAPVPRLVDERARTDWFGREYVYGKLYGPRGLQDDVIQSLAQDPRWADLEYFFIRYGDPAPHLRLRLSSAGAGGLNEIVDLAARMRDAGLVRDLVLMPYRQETDRYGGPGCIRAAESVFAASSRWVAGRTTGPVPLTSLLVRAATDIDVLARVFLPELKERREFAATLAGPTAGGGDWRTVGPDLWAALGAAAPTTIVDACLRLDASLESAAAAGTLTSSRRDVISSVLHLHCNRLGVPRIDEQRVYGLWRRALDRAVAQLRGQR
ncbi:lantibiotic dehydratase [Cellulomonas soli]|uniref:Lantibiotic dehydratase n=1 Tax=Cellulomonas soli TaxID=931535 RepID=A0A512PCY7_9CELL|nr:lantibiotic dehydratase [Cellulomonas soli]NYI58648.1 thiopeptide-type bacteriocin biosynthesis protein [Cellulomonas soli]GEP69073.1 lantibiotic dehydratase [Cellulomonas soli]